MTFGIVYLIHVYVWSFHMLQYILLYLIYPLYNDLLYHYIERIHKITYVLKNWEACDDSGLSCHMLRKNDFRISCQRLSVYT